MSEYWKNFWDQHVETVSNNPFVQVGRTLHGQPMSEAMFKRITTHVLEALSLEPSHRILDICCGNGLLSMEIAQHCQHVTGIDFSKKLVEDLQAKSPENVTGIACDALKAQFEPATFDRILLAAALQHFTHSEVISLFQSVSSWLKPGGIFLLTDIPDASRMWNFFDSEERQDAYFQSTLDGASIMGTWFDSTWLQKLARHTGFSQSQPLNQPDDYWYAHYRMDFVCYKASAPPA